MIPPFVIISVITVVGVVWVISGIAWFRQRNRFLAKTAYDKGVAYLQTQAFSRAEESFKAALNRQHAMLEARYGLGVTYIQQQRYREGIEILEELVHEMPQNAIAHYNLGLAYIEVGKLDDAQNVLQRALTINPAMKEISFNLSRVFLEKGDVKQAGNYCEKALQLDSRYAKARQLQNHLAEIRYVAPINLDLIRKALSDFDQDDTEFMIQL